jgi:signal transduction histidine kinase
MPMKRPHPPERPLESLPTLKLKMSVIILAAVAVTVIVFYIGVHADLWPSVAGVIAGLVALGVVWVLARGLTVPIREMVRATEAMARGDFSQRVTDTSHDEIGTLARSFNLMAAELAETDRLRRDLVANVSHELRTPITALQAVLENLVDGVAPPDPET